MQISDYLDSIANTLRVSFIVGASAAGLVWLNQQSLNQYWALHFHRESPWNSLSSPAWMLGADLMHAAEVAKEAFITQLSDPTGKTTVSSDRQALPETDNRPAVRENTAVAAENPQDARQLSRLLTAGKQRDASAAEKQTVITMSGSLYDPRGAAILNEGKKVLFIGDSMMEGVAPRVLSLLKEKYHAEGINLSKRSTGLAYPVFFNWPETTSAILKSNPDIGLLTVFLGPNDPWDMPAGRGQPYLKFGSEEWDEEYRNRIRKILFLAELYNIPVIWVLPPNMRKDALNRGIAVLDSLYESEVERAGGVTLRVNELFGYQADTYSSTALIDNKRITVRASDGIHYSPAGAQIIAGGIMEKIHFVGSDSENMSDE